MRNREIGGFIEFEHYFGEMLHESAIALNCGRSALAYLIKARNIQKIAIPYYMCSSVIELCGKLHVEVRFYQIDESFLPEKIILKEDEWIYLVDYYGQLKNADIKMIHDKYQRVIVDYAQAYFQMPLEGIDSLYTCRKFFGVSDGAFLYTDAVLNEKIRRDESFDRMRYLLGRFERTAAEFYDEYTENDKAFDSTQILSMSKLTENLLRAIDYERIKQIRTTNFKYLDEKFREINMLQLQCIEGAFAYPLYLKNGQEIRKELIRKKIYVPTLWPNVLDGLSNEMFEYHLANNILPLPCDQRYDQSDMEYICKTILQILSEM